MSAGATGALGGRAVLVTRPVERAAGLAARIAAAGGRPLHLPAIEIVPLQPRRPPQAWSYDAALFVSPAAVSHGIALLDLSPEAAPPLGAVGPGTARTLEDAGFRVAIGPGETSDSEGLLGCAALAADRIAGRRLLIVRGEGGREHLRSVLVERGAEVDYAEVYRRARPSRYDPETVAACEIVSITSGEALDNLLALVSGAEAERLRRLPLAAAAGRIAELARQRGFTGPIVTAPSAGDDGLMEAIQQCADRLAGPG